MRARESKNYNIPAGSEFLLNSTYRALMCSAGSESTARLTGEWVSSGLKDSERASKGRKTDLVAPTNQHKQATPK